ncbi:MAG: hypothetical protein ABL309_13885 [Phycisphaerales bacterium]
MSEKWRGIESDEQRRFLDAYVEETNPRRAALNAGIDPSRVEGWLSSAPFFVEWCDLIDAERTPDKEFPGLSETQLAFLSAFRAGVKITNAARIAGISRTTAYQWMRDDERFSQAFQRVKQERVDEAIEEAYRRAVKGTMEPVFGSNGLDGKTAVVGYKRKYSDRLLVEILRAERPEKYRSNHRGPSGSVQHRKVITIADPAIQKQLEQEAGHAKDEDE